MKYTECLKIFCFVYSLSPCDLGVSSSVKGEESQGAPGRQAGKRARSVLPASLLSWDKSEHMCRDTRLATDPARFQALMRLGRELTAGSCWRAGTVRGTSGDWPNSGGAKVLEGMDPSAHWGRKFPIQGTSGPIFEGSWDQLPVTQQGTSLSTSTWAVEGTGRRSSGQAAQQRLSRNTTTWKLPLEL